MTVGFYNMDKYKREYSYEDMLLILQYLLFSVEEILHEGEVRGFDRNFLLDEAEVRYYNMFKGRV